MPMLKTISGHTKTVGALRHYLLEGRKDNPKPHRAVRSATLNMRSDAGSAQDWGKEMDTTRRVYGNDRDWNGHGAVTFRHYVLSPSPPRPGSGQPPYTADELLDYARDWCSYWFGADGRPGVLGTYQVAIVIHDDSELGNLHAHIVVNNTDLSSGRRMQVSDANVQKLTVKAQDLARARGWNYLDYVKDADGTVIPVEKTADVEPEHAKRRNNGRHDHRPSAQRTYQTRGEREARMDGQHIWKDDIRMAAAVCAFSAVDIADFQRLMWEEFNMEVEYKNKELLYHHSENPDSRKCYGPKLGSSYSWRGIRQAIATAAVRRRLFPDDPDGEEARKISYIRMRDPSSDPRTAGLSQERVAAMAAIRLETGADDIYAVDDEIRHYTEIFEQAFEGSFSKGAAAEQIKALHDLEEYGEILGLLAQTPKRDPDLARKLQTGADLDDDEKRGLSPQEAAAWRRNRDRANGGSKGGGRRRREHRDSGSGSNSDAKRMHRSERKKR